MPDLDLKQTSFRVDAELLRKARYYLDRENKSIKEYLVEQLQALIADREISPSTTRPRRDTARA